MNQYIVLDCVYRDGLNISPSSYYRNNFVYDVLISKLELIIDMSDLIISVAYIIKIIYENI